MAKVKQVAKTACTIHGEFGSNGWQYHARWCAEAKASAKPKSKSAKRASTQSAKPTTRRAKKATRKASGVWNDTPSVAWLQTWSDESSNGANHVQACARANRTHGMRVGFANVPTEPMPPSGTQEPTHNKRAARAVKVTAGKVEASSMPAPEFLDRNGRPLHGAALERRVAKLQQAQAAQAAELPTSGHTGDERLDALERVVLTFGESLAKLTELVSDMAAREIERSMAFAARS